MNFTNDYLKHMKNKLEITRTHGHYYYVLAKNRKEDLKYGRYFKRSKRLNDCLSIWAWDKYEENKVLDLQRVSRCMDSKFCPNCRSWSTAIALHNFSPAFHEMIGRGYHPYLLTLTVPNVPGADLKSTIQQMGKAFSKFWSWYYEKIGKGYKGFRHRLLNSLAGLRALEVTVQKDNWGMYHPHFHIMVFLEPSSYDIDDLDKYIVSDCWSRRKNRYLQFSKADIQIMQLWKMAWDNIKLTEENYNNVSDSWKDLYMCDICPLDMSNKKSIYEVFKYSFKDTDIHNYQNFEDLVLALDGKKLRQGHGELYNLDLEKEVGEKQGLEDYLLINKKESPQQLLTREINQLIIQYHDYNKISRFKSHSEMENLE